MLLNIPAAIWFGALTIVFLFITFSLGVAMLVFRKNVLDKNMASTGIWVQSPGKPELY